MPCIQIHVPVLLACLAGCAASLDLDPAPMPSPATATAISANTAGSPCTSGCGDNGGVVDGIPFWGLYLSGAENEHHVSYRHFAPSLDQMKAGSYAMLDVDGGRLRTKATTEATWHYGPAALEGGIIEISIDAVSYYIKIAHVHSGIQPETGVDLGERFWTRTYEADAETYELQWAGADEVEIPGMAFREVCATTELDDEKLDEDEADLWQNRFDAVIFEGERYDLTTRRITLTPTDDTAWFNIACIGSLPAKMYLTRRTSASSDGGIYVSTIRNDRQAMARAWAADYCGTGVSFTHAGHKLRIRDNKPFLLGMRGWLPREAPIGYSLVDTGAPGFHYEAVWDANGAVCLDLPRMSANDPVFPPDPFMLSKVHTQCKPPPCTGQPWFPAQWAEHGSFLTATLWP